ncbi:unnamed protein product [Linum trigynum]|uniref:Uncharacterized protein n=1 Tax=Linum trigynum TaxID=586398 RepID=A0AAV2FXW8_9ROSI
MQLKNLWYQVIASVPIQLQFPIAVPLASYQEAPVRSPMSQAPPGEVPQHGGGDSRAIPRRMRQQHRRRHLLPLPSLPGRSACHETRPRSENQQRRAWMTPNPEPARFWKLWRIAPRGKRDSVELYISP